MAPLRCNYCLKPIATEVGIKRHIAQSPTCRDQWTKLLEWSKCTVPEVTGDHSAQQTNDNAPDYTYKWGGAFDGMDVPHDALDVPDGHLVHQTRMNVDPGPPDLSEPPSKQARVEEDDGCSPRWPSSGCFTEQYLGVAATILGKKGTVFESMEAADLAKGESEWAPFRDKDEWELAQFLMKNLGHTKIDELLKLSHVSK